MQSHCFDSVSTLFAHWKGNSYQTSILPSRFTGRGGRNSNSMIVCLTERPERVTLWKKWFESESRKNSGCEEIYRKGNKLIVSEF